MSDFETWTAQFIIPCFPDFESEVLRDGLVKLAKWAGNAGHPKQNCRNVFVVIDIDLLRALGNANSARRFEIGMRCLELVRQRRTIIDTCERGDVAVINLSCRMLD